MTFRLQPVAALAELTTGLRGRASRGGGGILTAVSLALAALFFVPIAVIVGHVFIGAGETWSHLVATVLPSYIWNTVLLVVFVGTGVLVLGVGTAWIVVMCRFPGRALFEWALILPFAVPAYIMAYTYTDALQYAGPVQSTLREAFGWGIHDYWFPEIRSLGGAAAMLILVHYPYVYLLARAAFLEQSASMLDASRILGCSVWSSFFRVALPLARPAVATGVGLALMETLADFGTVSYFGVPTFTTGIIRAWFSFGDSVAAAQLAAVLLGVVFSILLIERGFRRGARYHQAIGSSRPLPAYNLRGFRAALTSLACAVPVTGGFVIPAAVLVSMMLKDGAGLDSRFIDLATNSFKLAAVTAAIAVILALILAYGYRLCPRLLQFLANRIAAMGYTVPGVVLAIGVLIPFALFDNFIANWSRAVLGISPGLLLTGTMAALVFTYLARFLAVALHTIEAGLTNVNPNYDNAARSLGRRPPEVLLHVHLPLMRTSLLTAGLLVFVEVMKELPATLVMRPFNLDTLAVQAYRLAIDERLTEVAAPALAIVIVGLLPVILISRSIARTRNGSVLPNLPA